MSWCYLQCYGQNDSPYFRILAYVNFHFLFEFDTNRSYSKPCSKMGKTYSHKLIMEHYSLRGSIVGGIKWFYT
jgi:hypothetical protein